MQPPGRGALSFLRRAGFQREDIITHAVNCVDQLTGPQFINGAAYCQPVVSVCRGELGERGQSAAGRVCAVSDLLRDVISDLYVDVLWYVVHHQSRLTFNATRITLQVNLWCVIDVYN